MSEPGKRKRKVDKTINNKKIKTKPVLSSYKKIKDLIEDLASGKKDIDNPNGKITVTELFADDYGNRKCKVLPEGQEWGIKFEFGSRDNPLYSPKGFYKNEKTVKGSKNKKTLDSPGTTNGVLKPKFNAPGKKYHDKQMWEFGQFLWKLDEFKANLIKNNTLEKADITQNKIEEYKTENEGKEPNDEQIKAMIGTNWFMEDLDPQMLRRRAEKLKSEMRSIVKTPTFTEDFLKKNPKAVAVPGAYIPCLIKHSDPTWTLCNVYYDHGIDENGELDTEEIADPENLFGTPFYYYLQGSIATLNSAKKWGFAAKGNNIFITKLGQREKIVGNMKAKVRKTKFSIASLGISKKKDVPEQSTTTVSDIIND